MAGEMFEARARAQATFAGTVMAVLAVVVRALGMLHRRLRPDAAPDHADQQAVGLSEGDVSVRRR